MTGGGPDRAAPPEAPAAVARPAATGPASRPSARQPHPWSWAGRNFLALSVLILGLLALAGYRWHRNRAVLQDDLTVRPAALTPAAERINPNTATWASLARLPGIGPGRARAIVAYREAFAAGQTGAPAFTTPADLEKVPGLGPKTVQDIVPYMDLGK